MTSLKEWRNQQVRQKYLDAMASFLDTVETFVDCPKARTALIEGSASVVAAALFAVAAAPGAPGAPNSSALDVGDFLQWLNRHVLRPEVAPRCDP